MLSTILDGFSLGAIYALIALGYTMVYGIAKMLNFAHGDIIMVGAYAILVTINANGHPLLGVVAAVVVFRSSRNLIFCRQFGISFAFIHYIPSLSQGFVIS